MTKVKDIVVIDKKISLYVVRHGKTVYNIQDLAQGFADSPLIEEGVNQAIKLGKAFKDIKFSSSFCSDLKRQSDTLQYILDQNKNDIPKTEQLYGLREWGFGSYEEKPNDSMWEPIYKKHGIDLNDRENNYKNLVKLIGQAKIADELYNNDVSKTAERFSDIYKRAVEAINHIISASIDGGNTLIVASGMIISSLLYMLVEKQYKGELISNCSVSILEYDNGEFNLKTAGDTSFLKSVID
jgi:probable phosphoglycerate mutase